MRKGRMVRNKTAVATPPSTLQHIVMNIKPIIRNDTMAGEDFLVVPMVMITEGVHNGDQGPLYYPAEELEKFPVIWNHKPVVVYHPQINGVGVSACDPVILTNYKIGVIMNTRFEDGKLKAEAWLDPKRMDAVDKRISEAIENNQMLELSTGLFSDLQDTPGTWNNEEYSAIAINYRPDHLAVLPDQIGACSIEDGAGFLRLNEEKDKQTIDISVDFTKMEEQRGQFFQKMKPVTKLIHRLSNVIENELSFDDTRQLLYSKLQETKPNTEVWIVDVFEDYFVYEENGGYKKQEYEITDGSVSFTGLPSDVKKEVSYVLMKAINKERNKTMDKSEKIQAIIANEANQFTKDDQKALEAMEESMLDKLMPVDNQEPEAQPTDNKKKKKKAAPVDNKDEEEDTPAAPVANQAQPEKKLATVDEYINNAPAEMQPVLRNGLGAYRAEKKRLINTITSNEKSPYSEEELNKMDNDALKKIATLAAPERSNSPEPIFAANGDPVGTEEVPALDAPVLNFEQKQQ